MSIVLQGSTSGSVTLQEPAVAGTTVLDLPAVSGTILTTTSPKAGNVIQVVQATTQTNVSNSTTTYADSGLTANITPTSSSSKILVLISQNFYIAINSGTSQFGGFQIVRNSTAIYTPAQDGTSSFDYGISTGGSTSQLFSRYSACYLDSPATTSATTYKTQMRVYYTTSSGQIVAQNSNGTSSIILMEIAG
jgi:hypothetical protein